MMIVDVQVDVAWEQRGTRCRTLGVELGSRMEQEGEMLLEFGGFGRLARLLSFVA